MTTRLIRIWDVGCGTEVELGSAGLKVVESGGCPADEILRGIRNYRDPQKLADVVLQRWMSGYDGDPALNKLTVSICEGNRDRTIARAEA